MYALSVLDLIGLPAHACLRVDCVQGIKVHLHAQKVETQGKQTPVQGNQKKYRRTAQHGDDSSLTTFSAPVPAAGLIEIER